jgi:hypothetical protein
LRTNATTVLVDFVLTANSSGVRVRHASTALEVEPDEADALAQDVVVDLVVGTVDLNGGRSSRRDVGGGLRAGGSGGGVADAKRAIALLAGAVDVYVGAVLLVVEGEAAGGGTLRVECDQQQREEEPS